MDTKTIIKLAKKAGISLGMFPPLKPTQIEDGKIAYKRPEGLTYYGDNVVVFANLIESHNSTTVKGYLPSLDSIKQYTSLHAKGFIVGNLIIRFKQLGVPEEKAIEMANVLVNKLGT